MFVRQCVDSRQTMRSHMFKVITFTIVHRNYINHTCIFYVENKEPNWKNGDHKLTLGNTYLEGKINLYFVFSFIKAETNKTSSDSKVIL